jgi:hypothetical protein
MSVLRFHPYCSPLANFICGFVESPPIARE